MPHVEIRITEETDLRIPYQEYVGVIVDGKQVAFGVYGSAPEGNYRSRGYRWVEEALVALAEALGATASVTEIEGGW